MVAKDALKHHGTRVGHGVVREDALKRRGRQEGHGVVSMDMLKRRESQKGDRAEVGSQEVRIVESEDELEHRKSLEVHGIRNGHVGCPVHRQACHIAKGFVNRPQIIQTWGAQEREGD